MIALNFLIAVYHKKYYSAYINSFSNSVTNKLAGIVNVKVYLILYANAVDIKKYYHLSTDNISMDSTINSSKHDHHANSLKHVN